MISFFIKWATFLFQCVSFFIKIISFPLKWITFFIQWISFLTKVRSFLTKSISFLIKSISFFSLKIIEGNVCLNMFISTRKAYLDRTQVSCFYKMGQSNPFLSFQYSWQLMFNINFCQLLDSNCRPQKLEATTLPTESQPLPTKCKLLFSKR